MNAFLARLGQAEARHTARTLWSSGKRRRIGRECVCEECRRRSRDGRGYSDTTPRWIGDGHVSLGKVRKARVTQRALESNSVSRASINRTPESRCFTTDNDQQDVRARANTASETATTANGEDVVEDGGNEQESLWEELESDDGLGINPDGEGARSSNSQQSRRLARFALKYGERLDYKAAFATALAKREADLVAQCFFTAKQVGDTQFTSEMPPSTFTKVLELLQPANFVNRLASAHVELSDATVRYMNITPMRIVAFEYASMIEQVCQIRRDANQKLSLADYTILLRSARDLSDQSMGQAMWSALHEDGVSPDTTCWNYYMASVVWNGAHDASLRKRRRVIPANLAIRRPVDGSVRDYRVGDDGVRQQALGIFGKMLQSGAIADEQSFLILITAAAREGDMSMVKSLLKKVWSLDVDALMSGKDEADIKPRAMPPGSPLRPSEDLLFTLADAFGSNNDVPTALRMIDFTARQYMITVPGRTWSQLMEWTFVLAVKRSGPSRKDGRDTGRLPPQSLQQLWDTMTSAPYFVQPSMGMYNFMIKNLSERGDPREIMARMHEAHEVYMEHRGLAHTSREALTTAIGYRDRGVPTLVSVEKLRQDWEYHDLIRRRDVFWMKRWVRLLLLSLVTRNRDDPVVAIESIPALLWNWRRMAPTTVVYETDTGVVEFDIRTEEDMKLNGSRVDGARYENEMIREASRRFVGHHWLRGRLSKQSPNYRVMTELRPRNNTRMRDGERVTPEE